MKRSFAVVALLLLSTVSALADTTKGSSSGVLGISSVGVTGISSGGVTGRSSAGVTGISSGGVQGPSSAGVTGISSGGINSSQVVWQLPPGVSQKQYQRIQTKGVVSNYYYGCGAYGYGGNGYQADPAPAAATGSGSGQGLSDSQPGELSRSSDGSSLNAPSDRTVLGY